MVASSSSFCKTSLWVDVLLITRSFCWIVSFVLFLSQMIYAQVPNNAMMRIVVKLFRHLLLCGGCTTGAVAFSVLGKFSNDMFRWFGFSNTKLTILRTYNKNCLEYFDI